MAAVEAVPEEQKAATSAPRERPSVPPANGKMRGSRHRNIVAQIEAPKLPPPMFQADASDIDLLGRCSDIAVDSEAPVPTSGATGDAQVAPDDAALDFGGEFGDLVANGPMERPPSVAESARTSAKHGGIAKSVFSHFPLPHMHRRTAGERSTDISEARSSGAGAGPGPLCAALKRDSYADLQVAPFSAGTPAPPPLLQAMHSNQAHQTLSNQELPSHSPAAAGEEKKAAARSQPPRKRRLSVSLGRAPPQKSLPTDGQPSETEGKGRSRKRRTSISGTMEPHQHDEVPTNMQDFVKDVLRRAREETARYETAFNYHQKHKDNVRPRPVPRLRRAHRMPGARSPHPRTPPILCPSPHARGLAPWSCPVVLPRGLCGSALSSLPCSCLTATISASGTGWWCSPYWCRCCPRHCCLGSPTG